MDEKLFCNLLDRAGDPVDDQCQLDFGKASGKYKVSAIQVWTAQEELGPSGEEAVAAIIAIRNRKANSQAVTPLKSRRKCVILNDARGLVLGGPVGAADFPSNAVSTDLCRAFLSFAPKVREAVARSNSDARR